MLGLWPVASPEDASGLVSSAPNETRQNINRVVIAAEEYCLARGFYPQDLAELLSTDSPIKISACQLVPSATRDEWGRALEYRMLNGSPRVRSAGADGRFGSIDDVVPPGENDVRNRLTPRQYCDYFRALSERPPPER